MNPEQENGGGYHGSAQMGGGSGVGIATATPRNPGLTELTEDALKTLELLTTNITQLEDKLEIVCVSREESVGGNVNGLEAAKEPDMSRIDSRLNTIIRRINVNNDRILRLLRRVNL